MHLYAVLIFSLRANSVEDAVRRGQRQVEQAKIKIAMQMDDRSFQAALLETQIQATKDHTKWNYESIQDLIEGPLLNPKRMEEAIKVSRIIRKLMQFYHPFNHRFADLAKSKVWGAVILPMWGLSTFHRSIIGGFGWAACCSTILWPVRMGCASLPRTSSLTNS